jgi:hypothetical protein
VDSLGPHTLCPVAENAIQRRKRRRKTNLPKEVGIEESEDPPKEQDAPKLNESKPAEKSKEKRKGDTIQGQHADVDTTPPQNKRSNMSNGTVYV